MVNVQWLNEILFGHYSCLQQPDSHKYQQYNLGNPFRIDYILVPHLMGKLDTCSLKYLYKSLSHIYVLSHQWQRG